MDFRRKPGETPFREWVQRRQFGDFLSKLDVSKMEETLSNTEIYIRLVSFIRTKSLLAYTINRISNEIHKVLLDAGLGFDEASFYCQKAATLFQKHTAGEEIDVN